MGSGISTTTSRKWTKKEKKRELPPDAESSRVLFLLYLIHRTWNVVVDHVDTKSARWRGSHTVASSKQTRRRRFDSVSMMTSQGSCCSECSCSYCLLRECANDCVRYVSNCSIVKTHCTQQGHAHDKYEITKAMK